MSQLYRQFYRTILRRCRRMLVDRATAEDAAQTVFLRLYEHRWRVLDERRAYGWLRRTATNFCLNELRARAFRRWAPLTPDLERDGRWVEPELLHRHLLPTLSRQIPEALTDVAWLYYVQDLDQGEIARLQGISRRTVIARLHRFVVAARFLAGITDTTARGRGPDVRKRLARAAREVATGDAAPAADDRASAGRRAVSHRPGLPASGPGDGLADLELGVFAGRELQCPAAPCRERRLRAEVLARLLEQGRPGSNLQSTGRNKAAREAPAGGHAPQ